MLYPVLTICLPCVGIGRQMELVSEGQRLVSNVDDALKMATERLATKFKILNLNSKKDCDP